VAPQLPTFIVIGAMKSGTSTVANLIDEHPDGYLVPNKEVYFFDRDEIYARGTDWYRERFAGATGQRAVGEASPSYLLWPKALDRMREAVPDVKLIAILREPVARAYSHYGHERFYAREHRTFAEAIDEELGGQPDAGAPFWYVERGRYLQQLRRVVERFPRSQLLVLLSEDLKRFPDETASEIFRFLGIDDTVRPSNVGEVVNPYRENRFPRAWRFMMRKRLWRWLGPLSGPAAQLFIRKGVAQPPIDPAVKARLHAEFAGDNEALGEWLGRDLSSWDGTTSAAEG
jgi:hypothetical protein